MNKTVLTFQELIFYQGNTISIQISTYKFIQNQQKLVVRGRALETGDNRKCSIINVSFGENFKEQKDSHKGRDEKGVHFSPWKQPVLRQKKVGDWAL